MTMRVDADVLEWLRSTKDMSSFQEKLNAMLRSLMDEEVGASVTGRKSKHSR